MPEELELGTASGEPEHDPGTETAPAAEGATEPAGEPADEGFFNLSELSEEEQRRLRPAWHKMHGAYTKALGVVREGKDKIAFTDRLFSDQDFALQQAHDLLSRSGYQVPQAQGSAQAAAPAAATGSGVTAPRELVETIRQQLSPELQWMAESMANAHYAANQMTLGPMVRERQAETERIRDDEFSGLSDKLTETYPGWEQHEDEMDALLDFLKSDRMMDRKFGSKLDILHRAVNPAAAVAEAQRRMTEASRSRTTTGQVARSTGSNVSERVVKAQTEDEAWDIAGKEAVADLQRRGIRLP